MNPLGLWFFYIGGTMEQKKAFVASVYVLAYDNYTEADVQTELANLLNSNASMLDHTMIIVRECPA